MSVYNLALQVLNSWEKECNQATEEYVLKSCDSLKLINAAVIQQVNNTD